MESILNIYALIPYFDRVQISKFNILDTFSAYCQYGGGLKLWGLI